jgi:hypothetical protein
MGIVTRTVIYCDAVRKRYTPNCYIRFNGHEDSIQIIIADAEASGWSFEPETGWLCPYCKREM